MAPVASLVEWLSFLFFNLLMCHY